jgi:hypothetical protein
MQFGRSFSKQIRQCYDSSPLMLNVNWRFCLETEDLPIACSLTDSQLQQRLQNVLHKVGNAVVETKELEDGYAYRLPTNEEWLMALVNLVNLERQCCPFFRLRITVEPGNGPMWLELTGPPGTKDFLATIFDSSTTPN